MEWKNTRANCKMRLIDINEYFPSFLGAILTDKIGITELN